VSTSLIPAVIDALVTQAKAALPNVTVIDGLGPDFSEPGDVLMVGAENPLSLDGGRPEAAASAQQSWAHAAGRARDERGTVSLVATSWNGDGNQKQARDACAVMVAAIENLLRADPTLGVSGVIVAEFGTDINLQQMQGDMGAAALISFSISYHGRI
jgi:hypothetical protein